MCDGLGDSLAARVTGQTKKRPVTLAIALLATAAVAVAVLTGNGDSGRSQLEPLKIAFKMPTGGPLMERARDMRDAAELALEETNHDTAGSTLELIDANHTEAGSTVALINALSSRSRRTNAATLLEIELAIPTAASSKKKIWLLPTARAEGKAIGSYAASLGVQSLTTFGDGDVFGRDVVTGIDAAARRGGIASRRTDASVAGDSKTGARAGGQTIVADNPLNPGVPAETFVTPARSKANYSPIGRGFFDAFESRYGRVPDRFAIFAFEAVGLVVDAVQRLEERDLSVDAVSVREEAFSIRGRYGPAGFYDVLPNGRTTQYIFQVRGTDAPAEDAALIEVRR